MFNSINAINAQIHGIMMCSARTADGSSLKERARNTIETLEGLDEDEYERRYKGEIENLEGEGLRRKLLSDLGIAFNTWKQIKPKIIDYLKEITEEPTKLTDRTKVDGYTVELINSGVYVELKTRLEPVDFVHIDNQWTLLGLFLSDMYWHSNRVEMKTDHLWQLTLAVMLTSEPKVKILRIGMAKTNGIVLTYFISSKAVEPLRSICNKHDKSPECKMKLMKWLMSNLDNEKLTDFLIGYILGDGNKVNERRCVDINDRSAPRWWYDWLKQKLESGYKVKVYLSSRNALQICDYNNNTGFFINLANKMKTLLTSTSLPLPEKLPVSIAKSVKKQKRQKKQGELSKKPHSNGSASIYLIKYPITVSISRGLILKIKSTDLKNIEEALNELQQYGITKDDITIHATKRKKGRKIEYYIYIKTKAIPKLLCNRKHLLANLHEELRQKAINYLKQKCPDG